MLPASLLPASLLPAPFVQATLIALNLPLDLTHRYAAPDVWRASYDRDWPDRAVPQPLARPDRPPGWPFPIN
jgi:hypothetical protein